MDKKSVEAFFDACASSWDAEMIRNDDVISCILDIAGVKDGAKVLDVGCGTGVLFNDYLKRNVQSLTAVDISSEMVNIAVRKFPNIKVICGDAENYSFNEKFDCIVVYNAFPHFVDEYALFDNLTKHLNNSGRLTVAHGMSREAITMCHKGKANSISKLLPEADSLSEKLSEFINVDIMISDSEKYVVSGSKK